MAIIISRNNFGRPLPVEEQQRLNLTENREVAQTLERALMRIRQEASIRSDVDNQEPAKNGCFPKVLQKTENEYQPGNSEKTNWLGNPVTIGRKTPE